MQAEVWKKAFSLFLLFHSYNKNIKGIFEIWSALFPNDEIPRKRKRNVNHIIFIPNRNDHSPSFSYDKEAEIVSIE